MQASGAERGCERDVILPPVAAGVHGRRAVRRRAGVLQAAVQVHVQGAKVLQPMQELNRDINEAGESGTSNSLPVRWEWGLRLPTDAEQPRKTLFQKESWS